MMSVCAAKSMLMTGAMLPGGARAEATDDCLLLAVILAQDLVALRVLPWQVLSPGDSFLLVGAAARCRTTC